MLSQPIYIGKDKTFDDSKPNVVKVEAYKFTLKYQLLQKLVDKI